MNTTRVDFSDTQMLADLPLVLEDGRTLKVWNLKDQPKMFGWDDGQGTSIVADLRETDSGRRLFVSIANTFRIVPKEEVELIGNAIFARGSDLTVREAFIKDGRITTYVVSLEEVTNGNRAHEDPSRRRVNQSSVQGAAA